MKKPGCPHRLAATNTTSCVNGFTRAACKFLPSPLLDLSIAPLACHSSCCMKLLPALRCNIQVQHSDARFRCNIQVQQVQCCGLYVVVWSSTAFHLRLVIGPASRIQKPFNLQSICAEMGGSPIVAHLMQIHGRLGSVTLKLPTLNSSHALQKVVLITVLNFIRTHGSLESPEQEPRVQNAKYSYIKCFSLVIVISLMRSRGGPRALETTGTRGVLEQPT